jgi:hypothetical protein
VLREVNSQQRTVLSAKVVLPNLFPTQVWWAGGLVFALQLQNLNMNTRRLRVMPPTTKFFSISSLAFPGRDGYVAPGMIAKCATPALTALTLNHRVQARGGGGQTKRDAGVG